MYANEVCMCLHLAMVPFHAGNNSWKSRGPYDNAVSVQSSAKNALPEYLVDDAGASAGIERRLSIA